MDALLTTTSGQVRGTRRRLPGFDSFAFLGIPYAEPPVGPLRFAAPQPRGRWDGVLDATMPGSTPQRRPFADVTTIPEPSVPGDDILNVSVFTPDPGAAGLPVLVWIHGGGYLAGSPASPWYDGAAFNRDGVVTVNLSYRLGHQGFGTVPGAVANRGVLDWLAALRWVQDNIAAFGGDPSKVTIAGQSAGGGAVLHLLALASGQGLFRSALSASGVTRTLSADEGRRRAERVARAAGVPCTLEGFHSLTEDQLLDAQAAAVPEVTGIDVLRQAVADSAIPSPVVDGEVVPAAPLDAFASGAGAGVPLMMGAADDEFSPMARAAASDLEPLGNLGALAALGMTPDAAVRYAEANADAAAQGAVRLAGRAVTDAMFRTVVPLVAQHRDPETTWAYRWSLPSIASGLAEHCHDLPSLFDCLSAPDVDAFAGAEPPQRLADELHGAAVRFVTDGDPGWAPWGGTRTARTLGQDVRDMPGAFDSTNEAVALRGA